MSQGGNDQAELGSGLGQFLVKIFSLPYRLKKSLFTFN